MRAKHRKLSIALAAVACSAGILAAPASGAYTIGNLEPAPGLPNECSGAQTDFVQVSSTVGTPYVVPVDGTITGWSTRQGASTLGVRWKLKVLRLNSGLSYTVVGHDGPRVLTANSLNSFTGVSIPVQAGDVLGLNRAAGTSSCVLTGAGGTVALLFPSDLATGSSGTFIGTQALRLNITASVEPRNDFKFGNAQRNKKKGTARVLLGLPGPGVVTLAGGGVRTANLTATAAGDVLLPFRSKGKKRKRLLDKGNVRVKPDVTFTPTNGTASTKQANVLLKKR
jgi:hypothetical protein